MKKFTTFFSAVMICITMQTCKKDITPESQLNSDNNAEGRINATSCTCTNLGTTITKNIKTDFGAVGNGTTDDTFAFLCAAAWINQNATGISNIKLYIPTGTYSVGLQLGFNQTFAYNCNGQVISFANVGGGAHSFKGYDILGLHDVTHVTIYGAPPTGGGPSKIKFKSNLKFGAFDHNGIAYNTYPPPSDYYADFGDIISVKNSSCITIKDLNLDGNNSNCNLGGHYGSPGGYEIAYDGIFLWEGTSQAVVTNVNCNNFGRDGISTAHSPEPSCVDLTGVTCYNNCRNGLSLTSASQFTISNCVFKNSGFVFFNDPGCGVDIEPEGVSTSKNISFSNCSFLNNANSGMHSNGHYPDVDYIDFTNCTFSNNANGNYVIWPRYMGHTTFNGCTIRGAFLNIAGSGSSDRMKFNNCFITDWDPAGGTVFLANTRFMDFGTPYNPANVQDPEDALPKNMFYEFNSCTFDFHQSLCFTTVFQANGVVWTTSDRLFSNNTFNFNIADYLASGLVTPYNISPGRGNLGNFIGCHFANGNKFNEAAPVTTNQRLYQIGIALYPNPWYDDKRSTSDGTNTFAPQNGNGSFCRVQRKYDWPTSYAVTLANF